MTRALRYLAIAAACLTTTFGPAQAGDWNNGAGSIKDGGGMAGVPVPAPMPVPEVFNWYVRADFTYGVSGSTSVRERGMVFGRDRDPSQGGPFGLDADFFTHEHDEGTRLGWGGGVGYYFSPRFRGDVTIDTRSEVNHRITGHYAYRVVDDYGQVMGRVNGDTTDRTSIRTSVALASVYWDLRERGSRFVPYIGAGLGFGVHQVDRTHVTYEEGCGCIPSRIFSGRDKGNAVSVAGALHAGITYNIDPRFAIDLSYRYLMIGSYSTDILVHDSSDDSNTRRSKLTIGDFGEHQIRAGLRWNVH